MRMSRSVVESKNCNGFYLVKEKGFGLGRIRKIKFGGLLYWDEKLLFWFSNQKFFRIKFGLSKFYFN